MISTFIQVGAYAQCSVTVTGSTNVSCFGVCDGSVSVNTVGLPSYSYSWSPGGQTVQNPNDLCAGTHTVTMTDANSCVATATVTISQPDLLQDSTSQTNIAACDSCNGTATVYPYGGTPGLGYNHKWSTDPVQTTATATGLCPGTYLDTITDANGCQTIAMVTITQAGTLSVSTNVTDASSSTACDGGISASPFGGNAPYSYQWAPSGDTTSSIIAQCPGSYDLCVTDADGCSVCDSNIVIGTATNVNDVSLLLNNNLRLFPNPSSTGKFILLMDKKDLNITNISVMNIYGKQVYHLTTKLDNKIRLDLSNQVSGIYFVNPQTKEGSTVTKKIIINNSKSN